jgi:hypothetical protein
LKAQRIEINEKARILFASKFNSEGTTESDLIENAYETKRMVENMYANQGVYATASYDFTQVINMNPKAMKGVAQGSPTSPILANLIMNK